jgi:biopolymer transport protein ExbD
VKFAHAARRERLLPVDMTPMIDIVFQLLIFFLATTELAKASLSAIGLPRERGSRELVGTDGLEVALSASGEAEIAGVVLGPTGTVEALRRAIADSAGRPVTIRADRKAPAEAFNELMRAIEAAGGGAVRLAVAPPRGGR